MKKILVIFFLALVIMFSLSCHRMRGPKVKVGISVSDMNSPEYIQIKKGMESAPDSIKNDSELYWLSADNDLNKQEEHVKKLIDDNRVDVLIINCVSDVRSEKIIKLIEDDDLPVVSIENIPICKQIYAYVTPNFFFTGKFQAQYVSNALGGKGNVIILSGNNFSDMYATMTSQNKAVFEKFNDMFVLYQNFFNNIALVKETVDSLLKHYNFQIDAIIANNDEIALKAVEVLKKYNLEKKIITVGAGCSLEAVKSILNNELKMTIDLGYENLGAEALIAAVDMINLKPFRNSGLTYNNGDYKTSWILSSVQAYDKTNILRLVTEKKKYSKEQLGLK
jgi:ABC-type sugar transport system substrate-binding protein